jgi:hypothetical protein
VGIKKPQDLMINNSFPNLQYIPNSMRNINLNDMTTSSRVVNEGNMQLHEITKQGIMARESKKLAQIKK